MNRALVEGLEVTHTTRVVTREGAPWFVTQDACRILRLSQNARGHFNVTEACRAAGVDADELGFISIETSPGTPKPFTTFRTGSESGLNKLLMRSRKAVARPFQDWLARDVLPSIRKTGSYSLGAGETIPLPTSFAQALRQHAETLVKLAEEQEAHAATQARAEAVLIGTSAVKRLY